VIFEPKKILSRVLFYESVGFGQTNLFFFMAQRGDTEAGSDHDKTTTFKSDNARHKAISRIKSSMPLSPRKFSAILSSLIKNATPRKKNALKEKMICSPHAKKRLEMYENTFKEIKNRIETAIKNIHQNQSRNYGQFGLSRKIINSHLIDSFEDLNVRKKRNDAFSTEKLDSVKQYFTRSDMVRPLPCLSLAGKDTRVKQVMECSMKRLHQEYNSEHVSIRGVPNVNKSTTHGCWTLDFFESDIKLQAIYIIIEKLHFLKKF